MSRIFIKEAKEKVGQKVEFAGWIYSRRDHGKLIFLDLRDATGFIQTVANAQNQEVWQEANKLRPWWVVKVSGEVCRRPEKMVNPAQENGDLELEIKALQIFSAAETSPFDLLTDGREVNEELRLTHRYLDLRRERLQKNIRARQQVIQFIRDYLTARDFVEIETPILTKSTPEGARDYVVPSRLERGKFYALPQSPQQYKQLLMVAGFERYFQIARCFRDEDTRGDRQPEFTQLDLEMSFVEQENILTLVENLFVELVKTFYPEKKIQRVPFPRLTCKEVMDKYDSDKPDLRKDKNDPNELAFAFIIDFPMFEWRETEKRWDAVHHPFTQPQVKNVDEFWTVFKKDPSQMLARQYDFVLNGYEIGGGSIRIHQSELLSAVFEALGHKLANIRVKFGHLLEAFKYGVPPHGGIALGLDRAISLLQNEPNIREVIAFPKTGEGRDLMMGAPAEIELAQLKELGIEIKKTK